jgi:hypothetical protein
MLLRGIHVGPDKDLVVLARLELLVDEPFVVETVAQDEGVGNGPLQELGCDVGQVRLFRNLEKLRVLLTFQCIIMTIPKLAGFGIMFPHDTLLILVSFGKLGAKTLSIKTLSIMALFATLIINDTQHNNTQHKLHSA